MGRKGTKGGRTGSWTPQQVPVQSLGLGSSSAPDKPQILSGATKRIQESAWPIKNGVGELSISKEGARKGGMEDGEDGGDLCVYEERVRRTMWRRTWGSWRKRNWTVSVC